MAQSHRRLWPRLAILVFIAAAITAFYLTGLHRQFAWETLRSRIDEYQAGVQENLVLALAIYAAVYISVTALSLPIATGLSLIAGALFGRWLGTGVVAVAATLGATLAFLASRFLFRDFVERRFGERLRKVQEGVDRDGAFYLLTLRLVPIFPFFLVNLAVGLTRIRVRTFAIVSLVGMLPGTFVYVNAGTEISRIESPAGIVSWRVLLAFALLGLAPLVLRLIVRRLLRNV